MVLSRLFYKAAFLPAFETFQIGLHSKDLMPKAAALSGVAPRGDLHELLRRSPTQSRSRFVRVRDFPREKPEACGLAQAHPCA